nr:hypothetical protein [uncultured Flavobacterium sp.]
MKKTLIFLMTIVLLSGCTNDDETPTNQILGKWKLVKVEYYKWNNNIASLQTIDYSDKNITYDFRSNNKLIITGDQNIDNKNRESDYIFEKDYLSGHPSEGESKMLLVKIDGSKWTYSLTNGTMMLGQSYIDGANLYFERK